MLTDTFELYFNDTLSLVKSIVFKFNEQNWTINRRLEELGYTVDDDPTTWKYNMNVAGYYHEVDVEMTIVSSDTQSTITLSRESLTDHPRTAALLKEKSTDYTELVNRYPKQVVLIDGMLNGLDLDTVANADDFEILYYDSTYVYENERNLMTKLQKWLDMHAGRWWNSSFQLSDDYYAASFIAITYQLLIPALMNIRLEACKTSEVCQFHLWQNLSGHYDIDQYKTTLSIDQSLWLYRNIEYIRRRAGSKDILEDLIENIVEPAGLTVSKIDFVQLDNNLISSAKRSPYYSITDYDDEKVSVASGDLLDTEELFTLTIDEATVNSADYETDVDSAESKGAVAYYNRFPTNVLKVDEDGTLISQTVSDASIKANYWLWLSYLGYYTGNFSITIPTIGSYVVSPTEAFILFAYSTNMAIGNELETIPSFYVNSVNPVTIPERSALINLIDTSYGITSDTVDNMLDAFVTLTSCSTLTQFESLVDDILQQEVIQELEEEFFSHPDARSMARNLTSAFKVKREVSFDDTGMDYATWLENRSLDTSEMSTTDWEELSLNIVETLTGYTDTDTTVGQWQVDVIEILDKLTSYDTMVIEGDGSNSREEMTHPSMLFYDIETSGEMEDTIDIEVHFLSDYIGDASGSMEDDLEYGLELTFDGSSGDTCEIELGETLEIENLGSDEYFLSVGTLSIQSFEINDL